LTWLSPDLHVLGFTVAVSLLTGILFGVAPTFRGARVDLTPALKEGETSSASSGHAGGRWFSIGNALVVAQVALAIVVLVGAGLLVRTPTRSSYAQAPKRAALARVQSVERGGEEGAPWLPAELAAARAEILRAQQRLSGLSAELDKASRGEPSRRKKAVLQSIVRRSVS